MFGTTAPAEGLPSSVILYRKYEKHVTAQLLDQVRGVTGVHIRVSRKQSRWMLTGSSHQIGTALQIIDTMDGQSRNTVGRRNKQKTRSQTTGELENKNEEIPSDYPEPSRPAAFLPADQLNNNNRNRAQSPYSAAPVSSHVGTGLLTTDSNIDLLQQNVNNPTVTDGDEQLTSAKKSLGAQSQTSGTQGSLLQDPASIEDACRGDKTPTDNVPPPASYNTNPIVREKEPRRPHHSDPGHGLSGREDRPGPGTSHRHRYHQGRSTDYASVTSQEAWSLKSGDRFQGRYTDCAEEAWSLKGRPGGGGDRLQCADSSNEVFIDHDMWAYMQRIHAFDLKKIRKKNHVTLKTVSIGEGSFHVIPCHETSHADDATSQHAAQDLASLFAVTFGTVTQETYQIPKMSYAVVSALHETMAMFTNVLIQSPVETKVTFIGKAEKTKEAMSSFRELMMSSTTGGTGGNHHGRRRRRDRYDRWQGGTTSVYSSHLSRYVDVSEDELDYIYLHQHTESWWKRAANQVVEWSGWGSSDAVIGSKESSVDGPALNVAPELGVETTGPDPEVGGVTSGEKTANTEEEPMEVDTSPDTPETAEQYLICLDDTAGTMLKTDSGETQALADSFSNRSLIDSQDNADTSRKRSDVDETVERSPLTLPPVQPASTNMSIIDSPGSADTGRVLDLEEPRFTVETLPPEKTCVQPATGKLTVCMEKKRDLPGFEKQGRKVLTFEFQGGRQEGVQPHRVKNFEGRLFTAYLPNNSRGKMLTNLLKRAFNERRLFRVVAVAGHEDTLEPNGVTFKSHAVGRYGYPDDGYLDQLEKELKSLGFEEQQLGPSSQHTRAPHHVMTEASHQQTSISGGYQNGALDSKPAPTSPVSRPEPTSPVSRPEPTSPFPVPQPTAQYSALPAEHGEICSLCKRPPRSPKCLLKCKHTFCRECLDDFARDVPRCPTCAKPTCGDQVPSQPAGGRVAVKMEKKLDIPGFENQGRLVLVFTFPGGQKQTDEKFEAFLPNNKRGKMLMKLLRLAFNERVLFKVDAGKQQVQPNVLFKSAPDGRFGYPDYDYLDLLEDQLGDLGCDESKLQSNPLTFVKS